MWELASDDRARYEVLPFGGVDQQAAGLPSPVRVTVTCSPVHGPDRDVAAAGRLRAAGHAVTVHVAARMVRDSAHLEDLLEAMTEAGADDLFLIGGDVERPLGDFSSAVELLPVIAEHPQRPETIGVAGYPEHHPLISARALEEALRAKSELADYVTTQMCFDPFALRSWVGRHRELGMTLPVLVGMPGSVARRQLLKVSARIGVGPSLRFLRKQRGLRSLLSRRPAADRLYDELVPMLDEPQLNVVGFHYFTFNQLLDTWQWHQHKLDGAGARVDPRRRRAGDVQCEETVA